MQFNTAIFYDIENLIGGYNVFSAEILSQLSPCPSGYVIRRPKVGARCWDL
ncbi:MAG: hypothetical protein WBI53_06255 [Paludibacter sp.]